MSRSLAVVAEIVMGQSPPGETCNSAGVGLPLLNGPTEFGSHHPLPTQYTIDPRKTAAPGDLLFCVRGSTTGRMNWADQAYAIGRGIAAIRHRDSALLQPLVRAVIEHDLPRLLQAATGSTFPNVSRDQLGAVEWPDLSREAEAFGARVVGAFDDKVELNRRLSETLEETSQALFKSWFLDSESDASDQDGSLADAVDLLRDSVDPQLEPDTVFQHYSLPAYDAGREAISEPGSGIRSLKLAVPRGSVLLSKLNPEIERVWLPDVRPDDRAICSTEFLVLRPRADVGRAFVYEFLRSAPFRSILTSLVTGTTGSHQRAHAEAILQVPLGLPGPSRAAKFELHVGPMLERIAVARRESHTLVALRDALLPRLLSGEASPSFGRGQGA